MEFIEDFPYCYGQSKYLPTLLRLLITTEGYTYSFEVTHIVALIIITMNTHAF